MSQKILPDPKLLEILMCPVTRSVLHYDKDRQELISKKSGLAFPIENGVPVFIVSRARKVDC